MMEKDGVASRVISILWTLSEADTSVSLRQVASSCNLPAPTAHRLLNQLTAMGIVARAPNRRYRVGSELNFLGTLVVDKLGIAARVRPVLQEVVRRYDSPCLFSLYLPSKQSRAVIARVDPTPVRHRYRLHERIGLPLGAGGRSVLACLDREQVESVLAQTQNSIDRKAVLAEVEAARSKGYAVSYGEILSQNVGLAVAIIGSDREVIGNLTLIMPRNRWDMNTEGLAATALMDATTQLATALRS